MKKATPVTATTAVNTGVATGSTPTSGASLLNVRAIRVTVSAASGQLLLGGGEMDAYVQADAVARWGRCPECDFQMTPSGTTWVNIRDRSCSEFDVAAMFGNIMWVPNGVTVDGGANVTTTVEIFTEV